jgi:diguanylate cyclase (GGDEF)-like protein/PAS domain S-box-containing protein
MSARSILISSFRIRRSLPLGLRPGLRAGVLFVCALVVVGAAVAVSANVSDHMARAAVDEAVGSTEAVVRGFVDPMIGSGGLAKLTSGDAVAIDDELERLVASGKILRIKVWAPDGTVVASDLATLRGRTFEIDDDLEEALAGEIETGFSDATAEENVFEHGLANRFLEMYLPIRLPGSAEVVGVYEIYQDAASIEGQIDQTRRDVLVIVGAMAAALLALLFGAFSGASRLLARQNRELRRSEERFRSLVQNSIDVQLIVNADGRITYESAAVERVLGYRADDRVGRNAFDDLHPDDVAWAEQMFHDVVRVPASQVAAEVRVRHADGSWLVIEAVAKNLLDDPAVGGIVVNYRDITGRKALEDELKRQAFHDSLTGLANRALFADRLEHAISRAERSPTALAVLFLDLDDFKTVNDSLGHSEGDLLLVAVAERLRGSLRASDTIARMGGDEFAILIEDPVDSETPMDVGRRMLAQLEPPFAHGGKELFVRASVGVATTRSRDHTADEVLRNADVAMYTAKTNGKNRLEVFEPGMHTAALTRLALKGDLERALERGEFTLVYQPIVRLAGGRLSGVEALLRWQHRDRGAVGPAEFIPVAEETGVILPLGRWVLERACAQAAAWNAISPQPITMSVNVSGRQLQHPAFAADVAAVLESTGLAPQLLTLELTESVLMQDAEAATAVLVELKSLGVRLAIDDFGTGYSSLNYLRRFPIDELKIDRSFVASLDDGPTQSAVVLSILRLGETLRLETVAEGIEETSQLAALRDLGADLGQGYLFARPLDAVAVTDLIVADAPRAGTAAAAEPGIVEPPAARHIA